MMKYILAAVLISFNSSNLLYASEIKRLPVEELIKLSKVIVIGGVSSVASNEYGTQDISVQVHSVLKGKSSGKQFSIQVQTVGVKDFDPQLRPGDIAVFFLKSLKEGRAEKAYHGSIAVFTKPNFSLEDIKE